MVCCSLDVIVVAQCRRMAFFLLFSLGLSTVQFSLSFPKYTRVWRKRILMWLVAFREEVRWWVGKVERDSSERPRRPICVSRAKAGRLNAGIGLLETDNDWGCVL